MGFQSHQSFFYCQCQWECLLLCFRRHPYVSDRALHVTSGSLLLLIDLLVIWLCLWPKYRTHSVFSLYFLLNLEPTVLSLERAWTWLLNPYFLTTWVSAWIGWQSIHPILNSLTIVQVMCIFSIFFWLYWIKATMALSHFFSEISGLLHTYPIFISYQLALT